MEAIGKIKIEEGLPDIYYWVKKHHDKLITREDIFIIKHAGNAILSIDPTSIKSACI